MKHFSDLCKNKEGLSIRVDSQYKTYLDDDELLNFYTFARSIHIPVYRVRDILNRTGGETIDSVVQIWQLFLKHRAKAFFDHQSGSTNPYRTQRDSIQHLRTTCGYCIIG